MRRYSFKTITTSIVAIALYMTYVLVLSSFFRNSTAQIIQTGPPPPPPPPALQLPKSAPDVHLLEGDNSSMQGKDPAIQATLPSNDTPPKSNLGQQVAKPPVSVVMPKDSYVDEDLTVVYPPDHEVINNTLEKIKQLQLTPEEYEELKKIYMQRQNALVTPYPHTPKPITRTLMVDFTPGVSPKILRLSRGVQTTIVLSDMSGQPWMIKKVSLNRQIFSDGRSASMQLANQVGSVASAAGASQAGPEPTNVLSLEPLRAAAYGSVAVTLNGLATPVIFILTTGQKEVDMRVDAKIPGRNPDSINDIAISRMPGLDKVMPNFLDGVPPPQARRLKVKGLLEAQAWVYSNNLYVKTSAAALYPAYSSAARATDGMAVYRFQGVPNAATFTTGGQAITAFFESIESSKYE